jgi:hypothetical protein
MNRISQAVKVKRLWHLSIHMVFCLLVLSLMAGCATTSKSLGPETTSKIKKVGIVTVLKDKELRIFDHTEVYKKTYGGMMFGAIGGALEGIALGVEASIRIKISLGGNPDILRNQLREYSVSEVFFGNLSRRLSEKYEIVSADQSVNELQEAMKGEKLKIEDYLDACRKCEVDTMLKVEYYYGLAAYANVKSSAAVIANFSVYDVETNKLLLKKEMVSDRYFKKSRVIPEFAANDSELYKNDLSEAMGAMSEVVARDFGIQFARTPQAEGGSAESSEIISAITMTCDKPYQLGQDCSKKSRANRTIRIKDQEMKIAGSNDGKVVLIMNMQERFIDDASALACFELVRNELLAKGGITVLKAVNVMRARKIRGFFLELDGDGYLFLKNYSVE